jgi:hypothetical protein
MTSHLGFGKGLEVVNRDDFRTFKEIGTLVMYASAVVDSDALL